MARDEAFVYGAQTIGGANAAAPILGRFAWRRGYRRFSFECEFAVQVSTAYSIPPDYATLQTAVAPIEAALRLERQRLTVKFGGTTIADLDPTLAVNSGFNARPNLEKLARFDSSNARGYRFTCEVDLPANLTGQDGRQDESVEFHYDLRERRRFSFSGVYTAMPAANSRAQMLAKLDAHVATVLGTLAAGVSFAVAERSETSNDPDTELRYSRVYLEHVNGRRGSTIAVAFGPQRRRTITIAGSYVRTVTGTVASASTNYATYQDDEDVALLASIPAPLTPGTDCEIDDEVNEPNEQDDLLTFRRVYVELIHQQAPGVLDDPDIVLDQIVVTQTTTPTEDSPFGFGARTGQTIVPGIPGAPGIPGTDAATPSTTPAQRPVAFSIRYECFLKKTVKDPAGKWRSVLRAHMVSFLGKYLGGTPIGLGPEALSIDVPNNRLIVALEATSLPSDVLGLRITEAIDDDLGRRLSAVLSGNPHEYLLQQGFARRTRTRVTTLVTLAAKGKSLDEFKTLDSDPPGWLLVRRALPEDVDLVLGVAGIGGGQYAVNRTTMVEEFVWVASVVTRPRRSGEGVGGSGNQPEGASLGVSSAPSFQGTTITGAAGGTVGLSVGGFSGVVS